MGIFHDQDQGDEDHHGPEQRPATLAQDQHPGIEEGGLDVEDDEVDRHQEEEDRDALARSCSPDPTRQSCSMLAP